jgi:hypothetical protein
MKFAVSVSPGASILLNHSRRAALARRAARKVLRMGPVLATVIFHGPYDLRVIVSWRRSAIRITTAHETATKNTIRLLRKSA